MESPDDVGIRKIQGQRKRSVDPGIVGPLTELISGSKYLNCRWIFGFARLIVGPEGVGSAAKSVGSGSVGSGWFYFMWQLRISGSLFPPGFALA